MRRRLLSSARRGSIAPSMPTRCSGWRLTWFAMSEIWSDANACSSERFESNQKSRNEVQRSAASLASAGPAPPFAATDAVGFVSLTRRSGSAGVPGGVAHPDAMSAIRASGRTVFKA